MILTSLILAYRHLPYYRTLLFLLIPLVFIEPLILALAYPLVAISYSDLTSFWIYDKDLVFLFLALAFFRPLDIDIVSVLIIIVLFIASHLGLMGEGDVYLLVIIGLFIDLYALITVIYLAAFLGLGYCLYQKRTTIPFGPFILLAFLFWLLS